MRYVVRPLSDRTWLRPDSRRTPTRFQSSWKETEHLLLDEVERINGTGLVIEVDVREADLRIDGTLRANAREALTPAVRVAFETPAHGPLLYQCDTFIAPYSHQGKHWQHNVRAIALTLQALRAVSRYGAVDTGQQYQGFKALPAGRAVPSSHMTTLQAYDLLTDILGPKMVVNEETPDAVLIRRAKAIAHPDRNGGDRTLWDQVEQAARVLGVA